MTSKRQRKILVVDDDRELREMLYRFLTYKGFSVHTACHGGDGYEALGRDSFDMVITDIYMPHMNGLELLDKIGHEYAHIVILAMTGFPSTEIHEQVLEKGAYDCLVKPFPLSLLMTTIEKCFKQSGSDTASSKTISEN
jgi:DNA-binding NtrC family response regulator